MSTTIGLNLLYLLPGIVGGTQTYAESLIGALVEQAPGARFVMFLNQESADLPLVTGANVERVVCPVQAVSRGRRYAFEQIQLPGMVRRHGVDLLHSLGYVGPCVCPCPHIVTIHDVHFVSFGSHLKAVKRNGLIAMTRLSALSSSRVIAVSEFARDEIAQHLRVPRDRIVVVHEAARALPRPPQAEAAAIRAHYGIELPYIAVFTGLNLNKNIDRLIEAFGRVSHEKVHRLVLIGNTPPESTIAQSIAAHKLERRVVRTGYVPDSHIAALVGDAEVFVFPSLYEEFGLPALEAQTYGVALACSTAGSLPEIAGDGADFFDPRSVDAMTASIRRLLCDDEHRRRISVAGARNVTRFSWSRAARETMAVYDEAMGKTTATSKVML